MAKVASTEVLRLQFVPTIASQAAPTVAEINAGTDLTPWLTPDGLTTNLNGTTIDVQAANSRYKATAPGSYGGDPITAKFFRDDTTDTAYTTLPRLTTGYFVIRRMGPLSSTAFAAAQKVEVWPITVISCNPMPTADNEAQKFEVSCSVQPAPSITGVVAA
jgi:hypothetical protein